MNILLWVLQIALAFLCVAGGAYKAVKTNVLANWMRALSVGGWRALGVVEIVCGVLLVVPATVTYGAALFALETLFLSALYARYSLKLAATNPLVWSVPTALVAAFVAYGRYALSPLV